MCSSDLGWRGTLEIVFHERRGKPAGELAIQGGACHLIHEGHGAGSLCAGIHKGPARIRDGNTEVDGSVGSEEASTELEADRVDEAASYATGLDAGRAGTHLPRRMEQQDLIP